jgi:hypothetical protein
MTKISALYFLDYPDRPPENPRIASSEVRVEIGEGDPTLEAFDYTYAFTVYTLGFLEKEFQEKNRLFLIDQAAIIVPTFDPGVIRTAIESVLHNLDRYGVRID